MAFTVGGTTYNLTQFDIALTSNSGVDPTVELLNSAGSVPGSVVLGTWSLTGIPNFGSQSSIQPSQTQSGISGIVLDAGTTYWLAAFPDSSSDVLTWNFNSTGQTGPSAFSTDGGNTWVSNGSGLNFAVDVLGTPVTATPEPSSLLLLGAGLLGLWPLARRRVRSE